MCSGESTPTIPATTLLSTLPVPARLRHAGDFVYSLTELCCPNSNSKLFIQRPSIDSSSSAAQPSLFTFLHSRADVTTMTTPIPSPPALPLLGHVTQIDKEVPLRTFELLADQYGEIYQLNLISKAASILEALLWWWRRSLICC